MLCEQCDEAFKKPRFSKLSILNFTRGGHSDVRILHPTLASLRSALRTNCAICHRLVDALMRKRLPQKIFVKCQLLDREDHLHAARGVDLESITVSYRFAYETQSKSVISLFWLFTAAKGGKPVKEGSRIFFFLSPTQYQISTAVSLEDGNGPTTRSMDVIQFWMNECCKKHQTCKRQDLTASKYPFARIIDVGLAMDSPEVRVRPSDELESYVRYMTLSHCWGGKSSDTPSLISTNYEDYIRGIKLLDLPRTFRDAIYLARRLSVQYLWIDSLCIIQDSAEDWLEQAAVMCHVYQNSYLNVAATSSTDPRGGLFCKRNVALMTPFRIGIAGSIPATAISPTENLPRWYTLANNSTLVIKEAESSPVYHERSIDLNRAFGNHDGCFCAGGENYSWSARNVRLDSDRTLYAELRKKNGDWIAQNLDLHRVEGVSDDPDDLQSFRLENSSLGNSSILVVRTPSSDTVFNEFRVNLNENLGNRNGQLDTAGKNILLSAKDVRLSGSILSASLQTRAGGWNSVKFDVSILVAQTDQRKTQPAQIETSPPIAFYDVDTDYHMKWQTQITTSKLCKRGWVLQERLAAPRVVHFGTHQMFFECAESRRIEEHPEWHITSQFDVARFSSVDLKSWDVFSARLTTEPRARSLCLNYIWSSVKAMYGRENVDFRKVDLSENPRNRFRLAKTMCYGEEEWMPTHPLIKYWSEIVTTYNNTDLTYEEDRLLAISGLARTLSERTGIRYVAGLWEYQLARQLLWHSAKHKPEVFDSGIPSSAPSKSYIAPTWSWASTSGFLGQRGIKLEAILETKGAMDLIKILSIDVKGIVEADHMQVGGLRSGCLRIRGRLLPIHLDLKLWPEGANRPEQLVQYWIGSSIEPPTRETFLVPVLFTRWNQRLPPGTRNALLLESTEIKGVFKRIGVARLSCRTTLRDIVPQLYEARNRNHEDSDDDADTDGEARSEDERYSPTASTASTKSPTPQQELSSKFLTFATGNTVSKTLENLQSRFIARSTLQENDKSGRNSPGNMDKALRGVRAYNRTINFLQSEVPGKPSEKIHAPSSIQVEDISNLGVREVTITTRNTMWDRWKQPVPTLSPKAAIGNHFYIEHVEDEHTARYGPFVFEII